MNTKPISMNQSPLACMIDAVDAASRERHRTLATSIFASVQGVNTRPDGYSFQLPMRSDMLMSVAEWAANERLCCPFFRFMIEVEPNQGPLWIHLTGDETIRAFIAANFGTILKPELAQRFGADTEAG